MLIPKLFSALLIFLILSFSQCLVFGQQENQKPEEEIKKLKEKVAELEKTIAGMKDQKGAEDESDLEKELAQELGMAASQSESPQKTQQSISQETLSARRTFFQNMNPNISVIGTIIGHANTRSELERNVDLSFDEGEFSFQAAVDPFAKASFFITFVKEEEAALNPVGEEEGGEEGLNPEVEEAFITILSLPFSTQLKAGKFRSKFGKINETHPHAYNFIGVPQMYANFFGTEGLGDEGASLSWLLPNQVFFQELTFQVTAGPGENSSFTRAANNRLLYLAHLKNFFDITENTTLELGFTGLTGPNNEAGDATNMLAADLTLKWKPLQNRSQSFEFMSEFLISKYNGVTANVTSFGFYSNLRYQVAKRWFIGGLFDYSEYPQFSKFNHKAYSGILQFFTTEFQKFEIQYKYNDPNFIDSFSEIKLRSVFVIGAHGAHQY